MITIEFAIIFEYTFMHYLESHFDSALEKIVHYLVPEHHYKSVHDFFNPSLFHTTLLAMSLFSHPDYPTYPNSTHT